MGEMLRIASFNANSIRNRLPIILDWMERQKCDIVCVQETKVEDSAFPVAPILDAGHHCVFHGQKAFNGVAIISRREPTGVVRGLGVDGLDEEARIIRAAYGELTVVNTYVPQGTSPESPRFQYKLQWIRALRDYLERDLTPDSPVVWAGDLNVAREPIDVYDPEGLAGSVCFHPDEHAALDHTMGWGFTDLLRLHHPGEPGLYTFWDYRIPNALKRRLGWRIDYVCATRPMVDRAADCWIDTEPRLADKPSDHTFIVADFRA